VLPYCVTDNILRPAIHTAGFLGKHAPLWDIRPLYLAGKETPEQQDLLVKNVAHGASLAARFRRGDPMGSLYSSIRSVLPGGLGGVAPPLEGLVEPDHSVILMRGHGFTTLATGIESAVYQAIYTCENARTQTTATLLTKPVPPGQSQAMYTMKFLTPPETTGTKNFNMATFGRPWGLWVREVEVDPLYRNDVKRTEANKK
jgi:ribulose-5-phosphate 4-epimerase/fuculose-1-phosphate aldolase